MSVFLRQKRTAGLTRALPLFAALAALYVFAVPGDAYAYLDPGTGSYALQILLAAFFGAIFSIKIYWKKLKAFFASKFSKQDSPPE